MPIIPVNEPLLNGNEAKYLAECIETGWISSEGPFVRKLEAGMAQLAGQAHGAAVMNGSVALDVAVGALGIGPGDEVIIPANTFIATAWGATLCGATPVFVDCDSKSYNIDPTKVEEKLTPRTKAIVAVHLYGQPADINPLMDIARRHNLFLVEDCAQSHIAEYMGRRVGGLSHASSFSFYPGKNLGAYGEAGAVATNDDALARKFKMMRDHGAEHKYDHEIQGHNYRMEGIQGAVLGVKLRHLAAWTEARRQHAKRYDELLKQIPHVQLPAEMPYAKHVYHLYVIRAPHRDRMQKYLETKGIGTGLHYPVPLHMQKVFAGLGYKQGDFPVTEQLANECLSLPMYAELTDEQIDYVCEAIRGFYD